MMSEIVTWRGKPLDDLTREEAIAALKQACSEVARLQGLPVDYSAIARGRIAAYKEKPPA